MKFASIARMSLVAGLMSGGMLAGVNAPAQAADGWEQTNKVCKEHTAGTVCLEQRRSTKSGARHSRMVITPKDGQWIRPDVHSVFGWDFGSERGACDLEGCEKITSPMTGAWAKSGHEIRGLGYSTPHGKFNIYMGETPKKTIKTSGWRAVDSGQVAVQAAVKLKNDRTYYTGRLLANSVDGVSIQPRTLKIELLRDGKVAESASKSYQGHTDEVIWRSEVTEAVRMPSQGFDRIRVTATYEAPSGERGVVSTTYAHGR